MGDIGGTNDDLAAVEVSEQGLEIVFKEDRSTRRHQDFSKVVNDFLEDLREDMEIEVDSACFAVAGPVENQRVEMPHTDLTIDADRLEKETELEEVRVINDFDAIGYAVNILDGKDLRQVQKGHQRAQKPIAVVGAGTGLGKNLVIYDEHIDTYVPHSSEGGHADLPVTSEEELELAEMIKREHGIESEVAYEHVLSGQGLENIYSFLHSKYPEEEQNLNAREISETKEENPCSRETFDKFIEFYARCCRNYVLDTLPENGLYIVGGIAAKNPEEFDQRFVEEFRNASPQFHQLLSEIPIRVVTNYDISLKGAAHALQIE
ncbi:MAG: glucokinase [Candidatus Nanohaloarchaea archaeon]